MLQSLSTVISQNICSSSLKILTIEVNFRLIRVLEVSADPAELTGKIECSTIITIKQVTLKESSMVWSTLPMIQRVSASVQVTVNPICFWRNMFEKDALLQTKTQVLKIHPSQHSNTVSKSYQKWMMLNWKQPLMPQKPNKFHQVVQQHTKKSKSMAQ